MNRNLAISGLALLTTAAAPSAWRVAELGYSSVSPWKAGQVIAYHDTAAFRSAWTMLYPDAARRPALPAVDFARWRVLVVVDSDMPTGGYQLRLDSGVVRNDSAVITLTTIAPPSGCGLSEQITHPAVAVATSVEPDAYRLVYHKRASTARCN